MHRSKQRWGTGNRTTLKKWVTQGYSQRAMAREANRSQSNIRYWLTFYGLETRNASRNKVPGKCRMCHRPLKTTRRDRCSSCNTRVRRMRSKLRAIKLLGGKCNKCGWTGPPAGFDFHHARGKKEFDIGQVANMKWSVIEKELKKCTLLCKCCHAILHSKQQDLRLLAEI